MKKNWWFCGLVLVTGTSVALAEKIDLSDVKKIISSVDNNRNQGLMGELEVFQEVDGKKEQVQKMSFCFSSQASWFKLVHNDGKDLVHGFDGKTYFSRHGSDVVLTSQKAYSNYWRLDYLVKSVSPKLEWEEAPLMLLEALAGLGDYQIDCNREGLNLVIGLSKFVEKRPSGNDKFEIQRIVIRKSDGRILEKNHLVRLKSEKVDYYVPIRTSVFLYENAGMPMIPSRVRVLSYDMSKSSEPNNRGIVQSLEMIPILGELEYNFKNLLPIKEGDAAISRYSLKKGDTVYDVPMGGISYEVK